MLFSEEDTENTESVFQFDGLEVTCTKLGILSMFSVCLNRSFRPRASLWAE